MKQLLYGFATASLAAAALLSCQSTKVAEEPQPVQPPLMGWSSWNAYMVDISDSIIMHQADLMAQNGLKDVGYAYINIDDGFFGYRDSAGYMVPHPERFPSGVDGMRAIVDHIHSLGLKAGIYSDAGDNTCGSSYNHDKNGLGAGLYGHDIQDAERYFNQWDFDFIKLDYCGGRNLNLDECERYSRIRTVIDSVANKPIRINVCRWAYPGTWVKNIGESWRMSEDIRPVWKSIRKIVFKNLYLSAYTGDGHYNDLDMLAVGYNIKPSPFWEEGLGLSYIEEEAHFGIWCIMSSPLLLGCDMAYIPEETMKIITNKELIAINQDPLGLQAYVVQHNAETYVLTKDVISRYGDKRAVALYNPSDSAANFVVEPSILNFEGALAVRDVNRNEDLGSMDKIDMTIPAHSAKILMVSGKRVEASLYEAEWAYCPDFTAIKDSGVKYVENEKASGCAVAMNAGGSDTNYLQWKNVHSDNGGKYSLEIALIADDVDSVELDVDVNGEKSKLTAAVVDGVAKVSLEAKLNAGDNVVTVGNSTTQLPAVDKLTLTKL